MVQSESVESDVIIHPSDWLFEYLENNKLYFSDFCTWLGEKGVGETELESWEKWYFEQAVLPNNVCSFLSEYMDVPEHIFVGIHMQYVKGFLKGKPLLSRSEM